MGNCLLCQWRSFFLSVSKPMPTHNTYDPLSAHNSPSPHRDSLPLAHSPQAEDNDPQYDDAFTPHAQYYNDVDSYQGVPQHNLPPSPLTPPENLTVAPPNPDAIPVPFSHLPPCALPP